MKLRYNLLLLLLAFFAISSGKKTPTYPVSDIPENLLKGADAVIREDHTEMEVLSKDKVVYTMKYAVTVLKESGKDKALFKAYYNKLSNISNISATVYDAQGMKVKSIPQNEIFDVTAISGFSLYEDSRVKRIDPKYSVYPYTVEYSYQQKYNSAFYMHGWYVFSGYNTAVQDFKFKVITPLDFKFHYKEYNLEQGVKESEQDDKRVFDWEIANYEAPQNEVLSGYYENWGPAVYIAADEFELGDYNGDQRSWSSFGKFFQTLNQGRNNVPQETIDKIAGMLNEDMSDYEKISIIYQYSQEKNRYVSIQEGIGGQQPFDAETVDRLSYGDCKALSNYVVSLLRSFGFNAYYTLVRAGSYSGFTEENFVRSYYNHAIACVALEQDTVWLECTSPYNPCGYLGDFTDDRDVLMITEEGGKLVKTPSFTIEENNQTIGGKVEIQSDGSAQAITHGVYKGANYSKEYYLIVMDEKDRRKKIIKSIDIPHFELIDYKITPHKERKPWLEKDLTMYIPGFASKMGERLFFPLNTMNKSSFIPPYSRNRKTPMLVARSFSENDSIAYQIPEGYKMEAVPEPVNLSSEFGEYQCKAVMQGNEILYERSLKIWKGNYSTEKYNEFVEFMEKVAKSDEAKAVLVKG